MVLTDEQIEKFQDIYFKRFGKEISKEDACEQGVKLIRLMQIVYNPITEQEYEMATMGRIETIHSLITDGTLQDFFDKV
jgi:hypothetical protein